MSGETNIWIMNSNGSGQRQLTHGSADYGPTWSPDGRWIAYNVELRDVGPGLRYNVEVIRAAGGGTPLVFRDARDPSWSPDGRKLVFERNIDPDGSYAAYLAVGSLTGSSRTIVREEPMGEVVAPQWSPNGRRIAFERISTSTSRPDRVQSIRPGGGGVRFLTNGRQPIWSRSGQALAFLCASRPRARVQDLCVIGADGKGRRDLTKPSEGGSGQRLGRAAGSGLPT
jgi:Tol biopolymer transport system component